MCCTYVCTVGCLTKDSAYDLTAEYISHLDNSRFTMTGPQQREPRAHINPPNPGINLSRSEIARIRRSFSCVLCRAVIARSKVGCFLWECVCLNSCLLERRKETEYIYQTVRKHTESYLVARKCERGAVCVGPLFVSIVRRY